MSCERCHKKSQKGRENHEMRQSTLFGQSFLPWKSHSSPLWSWYFCSLKKIRNFCVLKLKRYYLLSAYFTVSIYMLYLILTATVQYHPHFTGEKNRGSENILIQGVRSVSAGGTIHTQDCLTWNLYMFL